MSAQRFRIVLLLLVLACVGVARAESAVTITRSDASFTFQDEARFVLEAEARANIVRATLRFRLASQASVNITEKIVEPAPTVSIAHAWSLRDADLPSGTIITYWWTVEDGAGNTAQSEPRVMLYEDTRFAWKRVSKEDVTLSWYRGDDALGRSLLDAAVTAYQRLASEFAVERKPAYIYIFGSYDDLRSSIGESAQEWTGGRAYPELNVVLIGVPPNQLSFGKRAVPHEFSHLIIHRVTDNPFGSLPRWLDEGLAMWAEGELEAEYRNALSQAVRSNRLLSLRSLASNFPADSRQATLAYAQSYSMVVFIQQTFGREKIGELLAVFREGSADEAALRRVLGVGVEELDRQWRASQGVRDALAPATGEPSQPAEQPARPMLSPALTGLVALAMIAGLLVILLAGGLILALLV